jgi:hypothetical protein
MCLHDSNLFWSAIADAWLQSTQHWIFFTTGLPSFRFCASAVFEGSEKRVEIDFNFSAASPANGLRSLSRAQLDELMSLAACTIVSSRTNESLDAYVLSESSLFVYPTKWVLKTCGTTKLLNAVPRLLEVAAELAMTPRRCKYSRASFLFPEQQVRGSYCSNQLGKAGEIHRASGKQ